jgi:oxygen-independent coproporphyrinogen-3 oxidase
MAGIYIHIPFCKSACHYCNFHFSTQTKYIDDFTNALLQEIPLQKDYLQAPIETLYFGGGTPSLLTAQTIEKIVATLQANFTFAPSIEFTIEANPDDITLEKAIAWKAIGINRLSIGIQSFQAHSLAWMNRAHTVEQSHAALSNAQHAGFENISTDLIYGTPHLSDADLLDDIKWLTHYGIPHISCYALTVEEKTALHYLIAKQEMKGIDAEHQARHFEIIVNELTKRNFEHYEISNFAQPGLRSKHNSNYWKGIPYLGLGPSAHSFNKLSRQWNVSNNHLYIQSIALGTLPIEVEKLDLTTQFNEYLMISLRLSDGFSLQYIKDYFGESYVQHTNAIAVQFINTKQLQATAAGYTLSQSARFFADGIASEFFIVN